MDKLMRAAAGAAATTAANGVAVGFVGASGATIMQGLGAFACGAALAPLALAAGSAQGTAGLVNNILFAERPGDGRCEVEARRQARVGATAGAVVGTAGSGAALAAAGVIGGNAAAITSGLALIGSWVGGGMAAGVVALTAGPALATVGAGYLALGLARSNSTFCRRSRRSTGKLDSTRFAETGIRPNGSLVRRPSLPVRLLLCRMGGWCPGL